NASDFNKIRNFLLKTSATAGVTNGAVMNASFDADDPETWSNVLWSDEGRVVYINWFDRGLAGSFDMSGLTGLTSIDIGYNSITSIDASGDSSLLSLLCDVNAITEIDLSGCTALESFWSFENPLTSILNVYSEGQKFEANGDGYIALFMGDYSLFSYSGDYEEYLLAVGHSNSLPYNFTQGETVLTTDNVYFFDTQNPTTQDITANFKAGVTSSPQDATIFKGGRLSVKPLVSGGIWDYDTAYLKGNFTDPAEAIFTGLKAGTTRLTYIATPQHENLYYYYTLLGADAADVGISSAYDRSKEPVVQTMDEGSIDQNYYITLDVTIEAAELPQTGQDFTAPIALAGIGLAGAGSIVLIGRKKKA
ncbi:MAG: LPXTG cell wall anchor domain-containing protein, partial [Dehalobacter sp.]|nr:LPXTG cell wall anchor domain-containing protein [Dehalobacter sp.]